MIATASWKAKAHEYIDGVLDGRIVACDKVKAACQRHLEDLAAADDRGWYFDDMAASRVLYFMSNLTLSTGEYAGKPLVPMDFQIFSTWVLFGWKLKRNNLRRFRKAFWSAARGNTKSPTLAAWLLYLFWGDNEPRAEVFSFATKKDQAKISWEEGERFVSGDEWMRQEVRRYRTAMTLPDGSTWKPMGSDSKNTDGLVIHAVGRDELHQWQERHRGLYEKITTATGKRRQPMDITTTTAGDENSLLWLEAYDVASQVVSRDSPVDIEDLCVFIAEIDDGDDEFDEVAWHKANPALRYGVVKIDYLRSQKAEAEIIPTKRNEFRRYHCNRFTTSYGKAIDKKLWKKGAKDLPPDDELVEKNCFLGFDWGWRDDLCALGYVWPLGPVKVGDEYRTKYAIACDVWVPKDGPRMLHAEPWAKWIEDGWLRVTHGDTTDTEAIYQRVVEQRENYYIRKLALDGTNAREFGTKCVNQLGMDVYEFPQNCKKYNGPTRELLMAIHEGRIVHGNNPLLAWTAYNMTLHEDHAGFVMPNKKRSRDKIDPMVAIIMALGEAMYAETLVGSYYENNELEVG